MESPEANMEGLSSGLGEVDWVAVYQASRYAFPSQDGWRVFALDGEAGPFDDLNRSVTLITAWNPDSEDRSREWNDEANARLAAELVAAAEDFEDSWGASLPDIEPAWKEHGFAVYGWTREEARDWGLRFGQRAVVYLDGESADLIFCEPGWAVVCGLRRFPNEPCEALGDPS
ncbi:MAG: DUF3293 domain-containing protein [Planctomycetes bacterium]|nr:DUF3293 domain-containing protein [Planctomycetota bacterium]